MSGSSLENSLIAFATSIAEPPPIATITSHLFLLNNSNPGIISSYLGFEE